MATKAELVQALQNAGVEVNGSETKSELEAMLAQTGGASGDAEKGGGLIEVVLTGNATYGGVARKAGERVTIKETELAAFAKAGLIASEESAGNAGASEETGDAEGDEGEDSDE